MPWQEDTMMNPPIETLLELAGSKFMLVTLAATRAREVNAYFNHLGDGLGSLIPPQVTSTAAKPLSIAFEEIAAHKITFELTQDEESAAADEVAPDEDVPADIASAEIGEAGADDETISE
ncbi:MAG: DNA-directed RNA polymerase subunit omega [Acidimicrobiales bacterium]